MKNKIKLTVALTATATLAGVQVNAHADTQTQNDPETNLVGSQTTNENNNINSASQIVSSQAAVASIAQQAQDQAQSAVNASTTDSQPVTSATSTSATTSSATNPSSTSVTSTPATSTSMTDATSQTSTSNDNTSVAVVELAVSSDTSVEHVDESAPVAPADADGVITTPIANEQQLPHQLTEPKNLANGTESRNGDYYGWYDVDPAQDTSAKLVVTNGRLADNQQKELADYSLELINNLRQQHNLAPLVMSDKIWQQVKQTELAYRDTHPETVDNHTSFVDLGQNGVSYNPTNLFIPLSSQNLGFGSATTMLEAKIDILNAFTAMAYKDGDSNNGHLADMLVPFKADQVGMVVPYVDYVGDRGGQFTWDYLTDFIIFDKRDLNTFNPVSDQTVDQELGLTTAPATPQNPTSASQTETPAQSSSETSATSQTEMSQAETTKSVIQSQTGQTQVATPQTRETPSTTATAKTLGAKQSAVTPDVKLQQAKQATAHANANLVLAQAQQAANQAQTLAQAKSGLTVQTAPKPDKALIVTTHKQPTNEKKLPNTGSSDNPVLAWTGISMLIGLLGLGFNRKH
ncbi:SEC10/PgrA surface exclusion domain-containing protein [Weissella viridescens]|uniref:SEC10/PgrA surface exclusion domain-containing protein n=1 Tax=Weissella viridescens TaxID=1629 RepID=A0A3P2REW5_WEIVI|nr:SEC10/PgrA surface exclusion domain-containing protein [Weissella viridescens]RRG18176.1 SEC10/PgrA surface exclusion domain-containing protein [Weissella viridescens]